MELPLNIDFSGKVVVITGAGGVLCGAMARAFAQAGAKVAALDLNEDAVKGLAKECVTEGFICEGYQVNVLEAESLEEVHRQILKDLGPCDILINGAEGNNPKATTDNEYHHESKEGQKTFFDLDAAGVDFVFKLNFQGTLLPTQVFAKDMAERKSGCILNISSMNAYTPLTKIPAYSAAKAGISNFTQWLATHFAGTGIRCNAIAPGFLVSNQNRVILLSVDLVYEVRLAVRIEQIRQFQKSDQRILTLSTFSGSWGYVGSIQAEFMRHCRSSPLKRFLPQLGQQRNMAR